MMLPSLQFYAVVSISIQHYNHIFFLATIIPLSTGSSLETHFHASGSGSKKQNGSNSHYIPSRALLHHEFVEIVHVRPVSIT